MFIKISRKWNKKVCKEKVLYTPYSFLRNNVVYEQSQRQIEKEMKKLEELARENIYATDKQGLLLNFTASLYHRTCMLAKKFGISTKDPHIIRAENYYNSARNSVSYGDKSTLIYDILLGTRELEKAMVIYSCKKKKR